MNALMAVSYVKKLRLLIARTVTRKSPSMKIGRSYNNIKIDFESSWRSFHPTII
jgi:hypothetical protein